MAASMSNMRGKSSSSSLRPIASQSTRPQRRARASSRHGPSGEVCERGGRHRALLRNAHAGAAAECAVFALSGVVEKCEVEEDRHICGHCAACESEGNTGTPTPDTPRPQTCSPDEHQDGSSPTRRRACRRASFRATDPATHAASCAKHWMLRRAASVRRAYLRLAESSSTLLVTVDLTSASLSVAADTLSEMRSFSSILAVMP
mmetsp:Transcript_17448/g.54211  ORF Transcript_17448/g.54211 Transcript_17448/m.54211 type:complete len:204 (+) Transcript_17448:727-1338(+)